MNKIASALLSLYVASFLYLEVPYVQTLTIQKSGAGLFANHLAIFLVFFILLYFIFNKILLIDSGVGAKKTFKLLLVSLALLGVVITILYHVVPIKAVYSLPKALDPFFAPDLAFTLWLLVPLLILFF